MKMPNALIAGVFTVSLMLPSCSGNAPRLADLGPIPEYKESPVNFEIIDHQNKDEDLPDWVSLYINEGVQGVETLPQYADSYVFVGKQRGDNLESLHLWNGGFSVNRDLPRLVSARVQARFITAAPENPGGTFGRYFETVIRTCSDTNFRSAEQMGSYWVQKRLYAGDGVTPEEDIFESYILVAVKRTSLELQINTILRTARPELPPNRDQAAAGMRLRIGFFNGF